MVGFFAFVVILVLGILLLVGGLQWISGNRGERLPGPDAARFEQIESALELLESRLDEIQEQQRFLERLLADRPERRSLEAGHDAPDRDSLDVDSVLFETGEEDQDGDH